MREVVVVTGSSGRIGRRLITRLDQAGYQPIGLDFMGSTSPTTSMEFIYIDISSQESMKVAFERIRKVYGSKIASIVHLAAFYSFEEGHLEQYETITVQGTKRLLEIAKTFEVEQFLFTSTMLIHKPTAKGIKITESSPIEGAWPYPASKIKTEELIAKEHGNIPYVILRIAGCYDEQCNCVPLSQHISRIYEKQLISRLFPGDADCGVSYIHFDDLIDMMMLVIQRRKTLPPASVYLAAEEDAVSYRDLQTEFGRLLHGQPWPMWYIPKIVAKVGAWFQNHIPGVPGGFIKPWMVDFADDNYDISMEHARHTLNWTPKRLLRQTLSSMVDDLKKNPLQWYKRHHIPVPRGLR